MTDDEPGETMSEYQIGPTMLAEMTEHIYIGAPGPQSVARIQASLGKVIASILLEDDELRFTFSDGGKLTLTDCGQSCCELRYMRTDDDLTYFSGAKFTGVEIK
jgi:hypothetical protein